ncbi:autoinducer binding domain-containing protein [Piscinibacter sp. XHJ-5]|uniref:helix-turn-helix transcriptional regulator n=1 Tax=Piscinibacter sp. XHJ-5 TaxID=3037797 RepID=UPI0024529F32|nr:autoinducer binding domain-containing protein [Piscinibacter sp. XHJ-5]
MLVDVFTSVLNAKDRAEFLRRVVGFANCLGFDTVDAYVVIDGAQGDASFIGASNAPAAFDQRRGSQGRSDPVMQHCKHSNVPIVWDKATYVSAGAETKWEEQASFGYKTGVACALHLPRGRHFVIGVDRDQPLPASPLEVTRMTAELQLFAVHAADAAFRIFSAAVYAGDVPCLTPRELESLRWTMEGKTAWEIGRILNISEQTAARHLSNATRKLDCVSKHHAVIRALRMGIIA